MVIQAGRTHSGVLAALAAQLWDGHATDDLQKEFEKLTEDRDAACFIQTICSTPVGFAQCQLRHDYVEGTSSSPVGYLEGIFILAEYRNRGYAKELLACCEKWATEKGCEEFASDCEIDNEASLSFHLATGFEEANRIICFKKSLSIS